MEDVKVREMQIFDYKKKIAEAETKLKQQQNLYEAVRSDRNLYSKNLIESQVKHLYSSNYMTPIMADAWVLENAVLKVQLSPSLHQNHN